MRFLLVLAVAAVMLMAACTDSASDAPATTSTSITLAPTSTTVEPATTTTVPTTTTLEVPAEPQVPEQLMGLELISVSLDEASLLVALADTAELRRSGLMFVDDLSDLDGMLFVFEADTNGGFWMKNTLLPLDIAFFDVDGGFVDGFAMEPCAADPCPNYLPSGSYRYALEMEAGTMPDDPQKLMLPSIWADEAEEG